MFSQPICSIGTRTWSTKVLRTKPRWSWLACVAVKGWVYHSDNGSRNLCLKRLKLLASILALLAWGKIWTLNDSLWVGGNLLWRQSVNPRSTSQWEIPSGSEWVIQPVSTESGDPCPLQVCQSISCCFQSCCGGYLAHYLAWTWLHRLQKTNVLHLYSASRNHFT